MEKDSKINKTADYTNFSVKVNSFYLTFALRRGVLNIVGYTSQNKSPATLKYDASFEDVGLPEDI
jgi:hypothetical protein